MKIRANTEINITDHGQHNSGHIYMERVNKIGKIKGYVYQLIQV